MTFRVGQKVVCVDGRANWYDGQRYVKRGQVYTVAAVRHNDAFVVSKNQINPGIGIQLDEVPLPSSWFFNVERFRPIVERKTSISIFTQMLKPTQVDA